MVLGHLTGDYLLQHNFMAVNKVRNDVIGYMACLVHCLVYSICVTMMVGLAPSIQMDLQTFVLFSLMAFVTHFPIDKWSLGKLWLKVLGKKDMPLALTNPPGYDTFLHRFFYWFVYIVVDNTLHLFLMTMAVLLFFPEMIL